MTQKLGGGRKMCQRIRPRDTPWRLGCLITVFTEERGIMREGKTDSVHFETGLYFIVLIQR